MKDLDFKGHINQECAEEIMNEECLICDGIDRTPAENLAYQVGWTTLLLKWEADEKRGVEVKTPSELFKWNQLGKLYDKIKTKHCI